MNNGKISISNILVLLPIFFLSCKQNQDASASNPNKIELASQVSSRKDMKSNSDLKIRETIDKFKLSLEKNDPAIIDSLVGSGGFTIIRNFRSGGGGSRGEDVRGYYPIPIKEGPLSFPVKNETPIELQSLFADLLASKEGSIPIIKNDSVDFIFPDDELQNNPSTESLASLINQVLIKSDSVPLIYAVVVKEKYFLLIDDAEENYPTGNFAIFINTEKKYTLKWVINFR